ncbi:hypothetical protein CLU96_0601 [Chryseobacterium sp. 52]|uniref:hypothetical protein n=1 Tax=Chryseobacterium sp. 52 TaxID=2035213 RepID=UPI000C17C4A0|nr:hypothetical protein [Chryseobacterium sp. 52]PIF43689.1 hypothetical protein CLU96_0601 [Chryseobacterium sp. 52]
MNNIETNAAGLPTENTPSQTLFRFVSLRSPQLSDEKEQGKRFILIPEELKEDQTFYKPVVSASGSKHRKLLECAAAFANNPKCISSAPTSTYNLESFKKAYVGDHQFGIWLARNKDTCTYEQFAAKKHEIYGGGFSYTPEADNLWNNLIYQVVTQKDFYIKEMVMQILLVQHVIAVANEEELKLLLSAKVVIPKELMLDENLLTGSQAHSKMAVNEFKQTTPTEEIIKQQLISEGKAKLGRYESLKKNFTLLDKQYRNEYQKEYEIQYEKYQGEIAEAIETYNAQVVENREKYCPTRTPGVAYDPKDPCQQIPKVPEPAIKKFSFEFRSEIEAEYLVRILTPENLDALMDILGYDFQPGSTDKARAAGSSDLDHLLGGRNTFSEINSLIEEVTEKTNRIIAENTETNTEVYTSIGGVILPMARTASVPFTYQLCPKSIYRFYGLNMALNVPDASWDISGVYHQLVSNVGTKTGSEFTKSRTGNTIFLNDLLGQGADFSEFEGASFYIELYFTNGQVAKFKTPGITIKSCISSKFELEVKETENPPVVIDEEQNFIPSGFGFKQIGIADYLKVEQSTHAYVEGEVAHIENIMAREYREKSTRKLRRSENTTTSSSDTEREQLSDTTTANRFEMQSEVSKMLQESNDFAGFANANFKVGPSFSMSVGANYANHRSKDESTRQAVTQAQDITARAMDRIVTKVHEERIEKIIDEFEENNSHGFDNKKGDKNVVGVYRWVDKLMKNQIYNYGKRMMFEFMVPEPAKLHLLGMTSQKAPDQIDLIKPEDPRTSAVMPMKNYDALTTDAVLKYWVSKYNVEVPEKPVENYSIGKSLSGQFADEHSAIQNVAVKDEIQIPDNYVAVSCRVGYSAVGDSSESAMCILIGDIDFYLRGRYSQLEVRQRETFNKPYSKTVPISASFYEIFSGTANCVVDLQLTPEAKNTWYQKVFKAILDSYEDALMEYNNKLAEEKNKAVEIKGSNPTFYRQIENTILRKNCISYMADRASGSTHGYGLEGLTSGSSFNNYETVLNNNLDKYTAFVKFMEQAFEWENLSYSLYPYYWGNKQNWLNLYQSEDTDPLFRAFMQSGMARVVVTVRPGFEETVQFYLATGKIWNGGEVPVIGDELYLSIADEMKEPKGLKQGKAWMTRLPTALNILQAESIGLKVRHALPFSTENPDDFEVPSEVITEEKFNFEKDKSLLGGGAAEKWIQLTWNDMDRITGDPVYKTIRDLDIDQAFPRIYKLQNNTITIDRDVVWKPTDSIVKFYDALADEISKTDGLQAFPSGKNGLILRVDVNRIKHFKLGKSPFQNDDVLEFTTDGEEYVKFAVFAGYSIERTFDKNGNNLTIEDFTNKAPLSKFLV